MPAIRVTSKFTGPLSRGMNQSMVRREVNGMIRDVVEAGVERLNETLRPRPTGVFLTVEQAGREKASTGHYRSNLSPRFGNLHARIDDNDVIYGPWLEGTSRRNQTTRFKGYASFRRTRDWLDKRTLAIIRPRVARLVRRLGGRP
tara:strand:+ start:50 stop:484 length:435 start_codon:yes stop_codon:yes gene_type:complete